MDMTYKSHIHKEFLLMSLNSNNDIVIQEDKILALSKIIYYELLNLKMRNSITEAEKINKKDPPIPPRSKRSSNNEQKH